MNDSPSPEITAELAIAWWQWAIIALFAIGSAIGHIRNWRAADAIIKAKDSIIERLQVELDSEMAVSARHLQADREAWKEMNQDLIENEKVLKGKLAEAKSLIQKIEDQNLEFRNTIVALKEELGRSRPAGMDLSIPGITLTKVSRADETRTLFNEIEDGIEQASATRSEYMESLSEADIRRANARRRFRERVLKSLEKRKADMEKGEAGPEDD